MISEYLCRNCSRKWEEFHSITDRDFPTTQVCPRCQEYEVIRVPSRVSFFVNEGSCGNSNNGYSSTVGDSEIFKAKSRGEKPPY